MDGRNVFTMEVPTCGYREVCTIQLSFCILTLGSFGPSIASAMPKSRTGQLAHPKPPPYREVVHTSMRVLVSLLVLGSSLYLIITGINVETEKWCYSATAVVVTYWLNRRS